MIDKAAKKWTAHKEMHDYKKPEGDGGGGFAESKRLSPRHNFELLNTPFGATVEQTIETAEEYVDRTVHGPAEE